MFFSQTICTPIMPNHAKDGRPASFTGGVYDRSSRISNVTGNRRFWPGAEVQPARASGSLRCVAAVELSICDGPLRVESAIPVFPGADAQIGSADYRFIKSPLTGMAEEQSLPEVTLTVRSWPIAEVATAVRRISN
jgi:hypothetical protein